MTRYLPGIFAMALIVVISNILVQFLYGDWLTWGAFTYPFAFLVTDVMNRVYGASAARRVVIVGFLTGVVCSLIGTQVMLQGDGFTYPAVTLRIAAGSGIAFLLAQLVDVGIFDRLRDGLWWKAPVISTLIGSTIDTALFFTIAFSSWLVFLEPVNDVGWANEIVPLLGWGPAGPLWMSLAVADWGVKVMIALVALIPFRLIVARLMPTIPPAVSSLT
ncbi:MAG: queuosine precursor transporter [Pseudomonadota bacterium]